MKRYWNYIEYRLIQVKLSIKRLLRMRRLKHHDPSAAKDRNATQDQSDKIYPLW